MTRQNTADQPGVAVAIIVRDNRVLMIRRRISEGRLSWQFPAGKIEASEGPENAAVREAREETGLIVAAVKSLGERVHPLTGRAMSYTACEVVSGTAHAADADEVAEVAWVGRDEIERYVPYGELSAPVREYLDGALEA